MPEDPHIPVRFAIAHLFTTGRDPSRDSILHFACRIYSVGTAPQINDWIVNPGESIRKRMWRRLWQRTGISTREAKEQPLWDEIQDEVLSFLEDVDIIFVRNSDVATKWFKGVVYKESPLPLLVDLTKMYKFFLPEEPVPYSDSALIEIGKSMLISEGGHELHKVLAGMTGVLVSTIDVILKPKESNTGTYHPVYSLLDWALSAEGNQPDFETLFEVASVADKIQWTVGRLTDDSRGNLKYDSPIRMGEHDLIHFIRDWKPSASDTKGREPFYQSVMGSEIHGRYNKDNSTSMLLQVLRFVVENGDLESDARGLVTNVVVAVEIQLQTMRKLIFEIVRRLYAIEKFVEDRESKGEISYRGRYEEIHEMYQKLAECLAVIGYQLNDLSEKKLFQAPLNSSNHKLTQLISQWVNEASERSGKLRKSLRDSLPQLSEPNTSFRSSSARHTVAPFFRDLHKLIAENLTGTKPIQKEYIESRFRRIFSMDGFNERDEQNKYAWFITEAINISGMYAIEAGTGTGKTLGYLIPVCEHLRVNKERQVVVASSTINLMKQILRKEWKAISKSQAFLYGKLKIATLKGKRNYLCASAVKTIFIELSPNGKQDEGYQDDCAAIYSDDRIAWIYLFQILTRNLGQWDNEDEFAELHSRITKEFDLSAEKACQCGTESNCSYPLALRKAKNAHVVITNHHKLVRLEEEIKQRTSVCIVDEADQFPDNLRSALRVSISKRDVLDFTRRVAIGAENRRSFVDIFRDQLAHDLLSYELPQKLREQIESYLSKKDPVPKEIFDKIYLHLDRSIRRLVGGLLRNLERIEDSCGQVSICLRSPTMVSKDDYYKRWKDLRQNHKDVLQTSLDSIATHFGKIENEFNNILKYGRDDNTPITLKPKFLYRSKRYVSDAGEFRGIAKSLIAAISDDEFIMTYRQKSYDWRISKMPFRIGNNVKNLIRSFETIVLTSGTLYVDKTLELLELELLDGASINPFVADKMIESPFVFNKQVNGAIGWFVEPEYKYGEPNEEWRRKVLEAIALQSVALDGRTLVLFRSWNEMQDAYECIHPVLQEFGIPLLLQDRRGSSEAIIQEFEGLEESVLFGTGRFWVGVDFPGPTLSQLIIVRIPNKQLGDPIVRERQERWQEEFWDQWYRPCTRRELRQGFGRLIRNRKDQGLFIILDRRILGSKMIAHQEAIPIELDSKFTSDTPTEKAVQLADWAVKKQSLGPELKERGIDLRQAYQEIKGMISNCPRYA